MANYYFYDWPAKDRFFFIRQKIIHFISLLKNIKFRSFLIISIPFMLSCFTHLWDPIGFPPIYIDEGHYMRRTLQVLNGLGPQESISVYEFPYDHPYFGQIFLAGVLSLTGYPQSLSPSLDDIEKSIPMLYEIPRLVMGILAIIDTILLFKIADIRYGRKVAFIGSTLFAVMPVTWFLRMILLENIMLPFLLSSVLLLVYISSPKSDYQNTGIHNTKRRNLIIVLISGILF